MRGGGAGAHPAAIVYDVDLTLDLPRDLTAGTAMNALAHCAEALYAAGRSPEGDEQALLGAPLIADALPRVLADLWTVRRARICCAAPCTRGMPSALPASPSPTRWRRRSAVRTGSRTAP